MKKLHDKTCTIMNQNNINLSESQTVRYNVTVIATQSESLMRFNLLALEKYINETKKSGSVEITY